MSDTLKRISSGIGSLDAIMSGGIPESTVTLVYGPPKTGKSVFVYHFLAQSLRRGEASVVVATDYEVKDLVQSMGTFHWPIEEALRLGSIRIVCMLPAQLARTGVSNFHQVVSLANPTDLMIWLGSILRTFSENSVRFRVVWDSLTPMFIYNPPVLVAKLLREFIARIKRAGVVGAIVTLDQGSVDMQSETILKASVDNVVRLAADGKLFVEGMFGTARTTGTYDITSSGLVVKS